MNSKIDQPDRAPDLRAISGSRGLLVVPWRPDLQWAGLHAGPIDPKEAKWFNAAKHNRAIFEIWQVGSDYFARALGDPPGLDPAAPLRAWAEQREGALALGRPLPDYGPEPPALRLAYRLASRPPDFRFVFPDERQERHRIRVAPWGFGDVGLDRIREPWHGAVGDVIATDRDHAVAYFARIDAGLRDAAEIALRGWAKEDDWSLRILAGTHPLINAGVPPATHSAFSQCQDCGSSLDTGFASHLSFGNVGYKKTRCRVCGGRCVWFDKSEEPPPLPHSAL